MQWFEKFDFDENPFVDNANTKLIGYDSVINEVLYNIDAGNIVFLEGKEGSGKTAILKKAINTFKGAGRVAYIDCSKIKELNVEKVLEQRYGVLGSLFGKKPKGMIILVDNIQDLSIKNSERIKYFYDQNYVKAIVFTGSNYEKVPFTDSLKDRVKKVIKIPEIKEEQAHAVIKERLRGMEFVHENAAKELFKKSQKNMKAFIANAEELIKRTIEEKKENLDLDSVKQFFGETVKEKHTEKAKEEKPVEKEKKAEPTKEKPKKTEEEKPKKVKEPQEIEITPQVKEEKSQDIAERYY